MSALRWPVIVKIMGCCRIRYLSGWPLPLVFSMRQMQNKIEESVYALLKIQINKFGLRHRFRILDNKIINRHTGAEFIFYGLWRDRRD